MGWSRAGAAVRIRAGIVSIREVLDRYRQRRGAERHGGRAWVRGRD
jgi:hypothetical protein